MFNSDGSIRLQAVFTNYATYNECRIPQRIDVRWPAYDTTFSLAFSNIVVNGKLDPKIFTLAIPKGHRQLPWTEIPLPSSSTSMIFSTRRACLPPSKGFQPQLNLLFKKFFVYHISANTQDVGIIVSSAHFHGIKIMAYCGPNAIHLVGYERHPNSSTADQNPSVTFSGSDRPGCFQSVIRIIY